MQLPDIQGSRVAVIGGTSGIGLAVARSALTHRAHVIVGSREQERVDEAIAKLGDGIEGAVLDISQEGSVASFFESAGQIDHLVITSSAPRPSSPASFGETQLASKPPRGCRGTDP